jgi:hypothetical protein
LQTLAEVHQQQLKAHLQPQGHQDTSSKEKTLEKFCRKLTESIEGEKASASFACGGTINIEEAEANAEKLAKPASSPVNIFWALQRDSNARKLVLPLSNTDDSNPEVLQQLVGDCSPATFGRGKKDVLDPKYRKAGKMDLTQFATNFDLPKFGILENVEQILLPSIGADRESDFYFRKLRAELYKLNVRGCGVSNIYCVTDSFEKVYSGPFGMFRKHVDTPRSTSQIGSLVICLPSPFDGGNLMVRHHGQEVDFDWSESSSSAIQWAAFYSDCEHEIKRVTKGHRITLTYNLYITESVGSTLLPNAVVDPATLPLHGYLKSLMGEPEFMDQGRPVSHHF